MPFEVIPRVVANQLWQTEFVGELTPNNTADINRIRWQVQSNDGTNPVTAATAAQSFRDVIHARYQGSYSPLLPTNYGFVRTNVNRIYNVRPAISGRHRPEVQLDMGIYVENVPPIAGSRAGSPNPDFVTASIALLTGTRSRYSRSSMHWGPTLDADVTGDVLTNPMRDLIQAATVALLAPVIDVPNNARWVACVFSAALGIAITPNADATNYGGAAFSYTGVYTYYHVSTQLTRRPRHGL